MLRILPLQLTVGLPVNPTLKMNFQAKVQFLEFPLLSCSIPWALIPNDHGLIFVAAEEWRPDASASTGG